MGQGGGLYRGPRLIPKGMVVTGRPVDREQLGHGAYVLECGCRVTDWRQSEHMDTAMERTLNRCPAHDRRQRDRFVERMVLAG